MARAGGSALSCTCCPWWRMRPVIECVILHQKFIEFLGIIFVYVNVTSFILEC